MLSFLFAPILLGTPMLVTVEASRGKVCHIVRSAVHDSLLVFDRWASRTSLRKWTSAITTKSALEFYQMATYRHSVEGVFQALHAHLPFTGFCQIVHVGKLAQSESCKSTEPKSEKDHLGWCRYQALTMAASGLGRVETDTSEAAVVDNRCRPPMFSRPIVQ